MSRSTEQPGGPTTTAAVRDALKQILDTEHYQLASPPVMAEVERIYQTLAREGLSISEPGFLLPVYSNLGELAAALADGRPQYVHVVARALAAQFLLIAETALTAQQRGDFEPRPSYIGCDEDPPF